MNLAIIIVLALSLAPPETRAIVDAPAGHPTQTQNSQDTSQATSSQPNTSQPDSTQSNSTQSNSTQSNSTQSNSAQKPASRNSTAAKGAHRKKKTAPPDCNAAAATPSSTTPAGSNQAAATLDNAPPSSTAGQATPTGNAPSASTNCPPTKTIVRQGGSSEPSIQLVGPGGEQAVQQRDNANQLLESTDENLKKIAGRQLTLSQQDMVNQIQQFIDQSKKAAATGDPESARTLAWKAQVLSQELVKP